MQKNKKNSKNVLTNSATFDILSKSHGTDDKTSTNKRHRAESLNGLTKAQIEP